jgi:hypothetical protein
MFELSLAIDSTPDLFTSALPTYLARILSLIIVAGLVSLFIEVWVMKLLNWGSWLLCLGDVLLLNFIAGLSLWLIYAVTHNIFPSLLTSNPIANIAIAIGIKCLVAHKLSDRPWIIVLISNVASYLSFIILLSCLYWFLLGFR